MINEIEKYVHYSQIEQLPKEVNLTKFRKWFVRKGKRLDHYMDHSHMLEGLNTSLNNDSVLYPENLRVARDNTMGILDPLKSEIEEKQYQERKNQVKELEAEIDDLPFLTPHSLQGIVQEGSILRHCMDSQHYIKRHTQGKATIAFIRRKEKPDMPYSTLEYRNQQVIQIQGKRNRQEIPEKVKQVVR